MSSTTSDTAGWFTEAYRDSISAKIMKRKYTITIITASLAFILDQWTKWLISSRMALNETIEVIPDFFSLHYLTNPGAAFGLFRFMDTRYRSVFFLVVSALAIGMVVYYLLKSDDRKVFFPLSLAMVLGGAMGNLTDRLRLGEVTDFLLFEATFLGERTVGLLDKYLGSHYWPSFNISDTAVVVGIFGMAIDLLFFTGEDEKAGSALKSETAPEN